MKQKYKEYLRLNKNILLAFADSITIDTSGNVTVSQNLTI